MRHGLGPVEAALRVEGDAVGVDVRPLEHELTGAGGVHDVQPPGLALRVAIVALGAGVGEPEPAVGPEGEVVRAGQRMPRDLVCELLDRAVGVDALDARDGREVAAAGDVAALRDVDRAVRAQNRTPGRAAGLGKRAELAVPISQQFAGIAVTEDDGPVGHHDRALGKTQTRSQERSLHVASSRFTKTVAGGAGSGICWHSVVCV